MTKAESPKRKILDNPDVLSVYLTKRVKVEESNIKGVTAKITNTTLPIDKSVPEIFKKPPSRASTSSEKPDWAKLKKEKKGLLKSRKKKRPEHDIVVEAKKYWEELRKEKKNCIPIVNKLHNLLQSHLVKLIMTHDVSRIVQWMIKFGTPEIRLAIAEELQPALRKMLTSSYAAKCVKKILKYGTVKIRGIVVESFMGNVVKLMCNMTSSPILEYAYAEYATPIEKNRMRQEFYSELYKSCKDDQIQSLADTFKDIPEMKDANLRSTKTNILKMINKSMSQSSLLYAVMVDLMKVCSKEDQLEVLGKVREWLPVMPNLKDAAYVGMMCVWYATNKEKKAIMKSLKGKVIDMAKCNHLHWILLALFGSTDDTVVLSKILLVEVINNLKELAEDKFGRRIVVHLVSHCDPSHFHPKEIDLLKEGEASGMAKKAANLRNKEIHDYVSKPFLQSVEDAPQFWFSNSSLSLVAVTILKTGCGEEQQRALRAVALFAADPLAKAKLDSAMVPLVAHSGICFAFRKMFQIDKDQVFSKSLTESLSDATVKLWLTHNQGCYFLVRLLETKDTTVIIQNFLEPLQELLNTQSSSGANTLKKILLGK